MHKKKPDGSAQRAASIDGIVTDGRRLGVPIHRAYQPNRGLTPTLGSFNRADGFHPLRQSPGGLGGSAESAEKEASLEEPIVLDDLDFTRQKKKDKLYRKIHHSRWRQIVKKTALVLVALVVATGAFYGYKFYRAKNNLLAGGGAAPAVCDGDVPVSVLNKEGDGRVNVLLLGIGGDGHEGADLTDTIMIASIDPVTDKIDLLSIPRDLWVRIPGDGSHKINQAYADAKATSAAKDHSGQVRDGIKTIDATLENVLGIPIHYHAVIDFKAFEDIVNNLGGVDASVPKELSAYEVFWIEGSRPARYYTLNVQPGLQHFDGTRALYFARERHNDSDFVRGERQRLLLTAIKDKALSLGTFSNPVRVSSLLDSLGKDVYTDFDTGSFKCIYKETSQVSSSNIKSLDLVTPPHDLLTTANLGGLSVVVPKAGTYDYQNVQSYVRSTLRDGYLAKENAQIAVYNATTTAGLATTTANMLKSYGYNIAVVDNATNQTSPTATMVIDLTNGANKYTRHYLEKRFNTVATNKLPPQFGISPPAGTAFVIIVGKDASLSS